jgi:death-on-curing protein
MLGFPRCADGRHLLIKNHCFVDGNKRTAALSLIEFLERNGYTLEATNDELYRFTIDVASSALDKEDVSGWLEGRVVPIE